MRESIFIESNATVLAPWGGYQPCADNQDCIVGTEATPFSLSSNCRLLSHPPADNSAFQKYCRCDFGMGGEFCTEMTYTSSVELTFSSFGAVIGFAALLYGAYELYVRGRPRKATPVLVAVRFAVLSLFFNFWWSLYSIIFLLGGLHGDALIAPRWMYSNLLIPFTFIFTLTSVLILSLSWRNVVNAWRKYNRNVDAQAMALREVRIRKFMLFVLVVFYLVGTVAMTLGTIIYASAVTVFLYITTIIVFARSSKKFRREISTNTQSKSLTGEENRLNVALEYARQANRNATCGLVVVVLFQMFLAVVLEKIGYTTNPNEVGIVTFILFFLQMGVVLTGVFVVHYGWQTRQTGNPNKSTSGAGGSRTALTLGTNDNDDSLFEYMNVESSKI